ncbi:hypothetical protein QE375_001613 [Microbacterium foliorum]|uniref:Uncharacterized protein n=1 Tax=Microbacterium foliorum TaxID=104336 RepID=A0ABU1HPS4_9MICO|nr:hypothetical protein [Microbacterium foliorum]MDR6142059.1 hypothetical protein [Microbacterium foliorum]
MSDRYCIRGCASRGEHYAACPDYGKEDGSCRGCRPAEARDGVLLCERCYRTLRRHLEDAADLVGHLRSIADPTKATPYDRIRVDSSRPDMPAPVAADLIDSSDHIVRTMRGWALYVQFGGDSPWRAEGLEAGIDAASAWDDVNGCAEVILDELDSLANDSHQVEALCEGVMVVHPGEPETWSIADAAVRYALDDEPRWANAACPDCDLMAVRVQPGRNRRPTRYRCTTVGCEWEANSIDDGGLWASFFAEPVVILEDIEHPRTYPHLLTLTDAAKIAKRTVATVRKWVHDGDLDRDLGRVKEQDVLAVAALKRGDAA